MMKGRKINLFKDKFLSYQSHQTNYSYIQTLKMKKILKIMMKIVNSVNGDYEIYILRY